MIPGSSQSVYITNANTKTVTIDAVTSASYPGSMALSNLSVYAPGGDTNSFELLNAGTTTPLAIQNGCTISDGGSLIMTNSVLQLALAVPPGETNDYILSVDGAAFIAGSTLIVTNGPLIVGNTGRGTYVQDGGTSSFGYAELGLNADARGELTLLSGNLSFPVTLKRTPPAWITLGRHPQGTGIVWVVGGQLTAAPGNLVIGEYGSGELTVSNGLVQAALTDVGSVSGSHGTLTIAGGSLIMRSSTRIFIGTRGGATGTVWVTGGTLDGSVGFVPFPTIAVGVSGV